MKTYNYTKQVDPGALHKQLASASFAVIGITYDSGNNQTTIMLED
jgi:hypothetical protein